MIFYSLAHFLRLNFFSQWMTVNKYSFTIVVGTLLWSVLWQFTRSYIGNSIIIKSIHSGFYYIVIADLYTFFLNSSSIYSNNIYNKNFHDINYYNTLEMLPIPKSNKKTPISSPPIATTHNDIIYNKEDDIVFNKDDDEVPEDVSSSSEENINKKEETDTA